MKIELKKVETILKKLLEPLLDLPKYQAIYSALREAIISEKLPDRCELPATRPLADALNISRSTVIKAYDLLKLEGYLESVEGSAHIIRFASPGKAVEFIEEAKSNKYVALSSSAESFTKTASRLNSIDNTSVAFRPGVPPLDLFPIEKWRKLQNEYWKFVRASELTYHSGSGITALRQTIANYLKLRRGIQCDYQQIFVVGGSLQSLFLIGSLLTDPEDEVLMEDPTFPNVYSVFKGLLRAKVLGIPIDKDGIDIDQLEEAISPQSKMVHVTPACHYPLGNQMSEKRKIELLELANRKGIYLIENDYEHEINYPKHDGQPLFSFDKQDRSFYLSTFNRTLHPSIRVGFAVVPVHLSASFEALIMHSHRSISPVLQSVLRGFIEKKYLHDHMNNVVKHAQIRHELFLSRVLEHLSDELEPMQSATPSLHILCKLKKKEEDTQVVERLMEYGIIAHPLSKCFVHKPAIQGLIFGFSSIRPQHLDAHFSKLIKGMKGLSKEIRV